MSVSKLNFEIRKYIIIYKTNNNKKTNFSISPTNLAINYSAHRLISVHYSLLEVGRKLKYRRIYSSVKFYHRGFVSLRNWYLVVCTKYPVWSLEDAEQHTLGHGYVQHYHSRR